MNIEAYFYKTLHWFILICTITLIVLMIFSVYEDTRIQTGVIESKQSFLEGYRENVVGDISHLNMLFHNEPKRFKSDIQYGFLMNGKIRKVKKNEYEKYKVGEQVRFCGEISLTSGLTATILEHYNSTCR